MRKSNRPAKGFGGAEGVTGTAADSGKSHSQCGDVCQRVQVGSTVCVTNPKTFLAGSLEAGVVTFAFGAQGIRAFEVGAVPVNGKSVGIWDSFVFGAASVFLAIVPVFVVTGAAVGFGLAERTTELLARTAMAIGSLTIFVHGKAGVAEGIAGRKFFRVFCIAFVQWNDSFTPADVFYQVVEGGHIIGFVTQEGTLLKRDEMVGSGKYFPRNGRIRHIGGGSQFIKGQAGNAVHQHMVFVSPVKLISPLIVLIGGGMNARRTVRIGFGMVFWFELIFGKGFWIVLRCVCRNRGLIQANIKLRLDSANK